MKFVKNKNAYCKMQFLITKCIKHFVLWLNYTVYIYYKNKIYLTIYWYPWS